MTAADQTAIHSERHPLAGKAVDVTIQHFGGVAGAVDDSWWVVEDWWDRVAGRSWMESTGNPAAIAYALRSGFAGLPVDNDVVYCHDRSGRGHLVHVTEIVGRVS